MNIINLTESLSKDFFNENSVIVLDFYSNGCNPCKMLSLLLESITSSDEKFSTLAIAKVRIDTEQGLAKQFSIRSAPTLLLLKDGEVIDKKINQFNREAVEQFLTKALAVGD